MQNIINKVYVINLKRRPDRWDMIKKHFENTGLELNRIDAVDGSLLTEKEVKNITTPLSFQLASNGMIGCWQSHVNIWKKIVDNNEDRVLILEDDAFPTKYFDKLEEYWALVPDEWDIVYLGCLGSSNIDRALNEKKIFTPTVPLATHAYILSNVGAQKLVNSGVFDKTKLHVDWALSSFFLKNKDMKIYVFNKDLIKQTMETLNSDNQNKSHPIIVKLTDFEVCGQNISNPLFGDLLFIRKLGFSVTIYFLFLIIISVIFMKCASKKTNKDFLFAIIILYITETCLSPKYIKQNGMELILIIASSLVSSLLLK